MLAGWIGEKIWHESKKARKNGDGSLDLTFRVAGLDEIMRWVLSFGSEAMVLEPKRLIENVQKDLLTTLESYKGRLPYPGIKDREIQALL